MDRAKELAAVLIEASPSSLTRAKRLLTASGRGQHRRRSRTRRPGKRAHPLHPRFQRRLASFLEKRKPQWRGDSE